MPSAVRPPISSSGPPKVTTRLGIRLASPASVISHWPTKALPSSRILSRATSPRSSGVSGGEGDDAPIARQLLSDRLQRLACDLEGVRGRERVLIGGHDRHDLRAETRELLAEQIEVAVITIAGRA